MNYHTYQILFIELFKTNFNLSVEFRQIICYCKNMIMLYKTQFIIKKCYSKKEIMEETEENRIL